MNKIPHLLIFLFITHVCHGQTDSIAGNKKKGRGSSLLAHVEYGAMSQVTNIGFGRMIDYSQKSYKAKLLCYSLGTDLYLHEHKALFGPKFMIEYHSIDLPHFPWSIKLSTVDYIFDGEQDLRMLPEIGLNLGVYFSLTYGYGFSLFKTTFDYINHNRLSVTCRFPFDVQKLAGN